MKVLVMTVLLVSLSALAADSCAEKEATEAGERCQSAPELMKMDCCQEEAMLACGSTNWPAINWFRNLCMESAAQNF